jgi:hypothetical protein
MPSVQPEFGGSGVPRTPVLDHSDSDRLTPVLNDDLFAVLLDDTLALPASDGFDLVAQSSPSTSHNHCGRVLDGSSP